MTHARREAETKPPQSLALSYVGPWRISTVDIGRLGDAQRLMVEMREVVAVLGGMPRLGERSFETMVFRGDDSHDLDVEHYDTAEAALAGHEAMCAKWAEKEEP